MLHWNLFAILLAILHRASSITRQDGEGAYSVEVYVIIDGVREQVTDLCTNCAYVVSDP